MTEIPTAGIEFEEQKRDAMERLLNGFDPATHPPEKDPAPYLAQLVKYYNTRIAHYREGNPLPSVQGGLIPRAFYFTRMCMALGWMLSCENPQKEPAIDITVVGEVLWDVSLEMEHVLTSANTQINAELKGI